MCNSVKTGLSLRYRARCIDVPVGESVEMKQH